MTGDGSLHTRVVSWLKVVLPLMALALLATLFLVSDQVETTTAIPYSQVEVEDRLREPRMTAPTYSGLTDDGATLTVEADAARPGAGITPGESSASGLSGRLASPDGRGADLRASLARIDQDARQLFLDGSVVVTTTEGFTLKTEALVVAMDRSHLESRAPVAADGPPGRITADHMQMTRGEQAEEGYVLVFNGSVKLVYGATD